MRWMIALLLCPALAWAQDDPEEVEDEAPYTAVPEAPYTTVPAAPYTAVPEAPYTTVPAAPYTTVPEALAGDVGAAIQAACASEAACGCGVPDCEAKYAQSAAVGGAGLFQCLAALDCAAKCDPAAGQPGAVAHTTCIAPVISRIEAQAADQATAQAAHHKMMMGIINNYPTGGVPKKRVYDQNGILLREE